MRKITKALTWLSSARGLEAWALPALSVRHTIQDGGRLPVVSCDETGNVSIAWPNAWLEQASDDDVRGALLMGAAHVALGHGWRLARYSARQTAGEAEAALLITQAQGAPDSIAAIALRHERFRGQCAEQIAKALEQEPETDEGDGADGESGAQGQAGGGAGGSGDAEAEPEGGDGSDDATEGATLCAFDASQPQAAQHAQSQLAGVAAIAQLTGAGDLAAEAFRTITSRLPSETNWQSALASYLRRLGGRNDWLRLSRRSAPGIVMPRKRRDAGCVYIARDVSGSQGFSDVEKHAAEAIAIARTVAAGSTLIVADFDVRLVARHELTATEPVPEAKYTGGGTDFRPAIADAIASGADVVVICTADAWGHWPSEKPDIPVLVVGVAPEYVEHVPPWAALVR
jgi:hypothetical protein